MASRQPEPIGWKTKLGRSVVALVAIGTVARLTVLTTLFVHGDAMAPAFADGSLAVILRGNSLALPGGCVVFREPATMQSENPELAESHPLLPAAAITQQAIASRWDTLEGEARSGAATKKTWRVARVIAKPGDRIRFDVAAQALIVNDVALQYIDGTATLGDLSWTATSSPSQADLARRLALFDDEGGTPSVHAPGFLVLSDDAVLGSCCDSQALGWLTADEIEGRVVRTFSF